MDYVRSKLANFESKVYLPEDPGVVQLENFGTHVHSNGEVIFGVKVEGVMDKIRDDIPVDLISRLVFDLHEDSAATLERGVKLAPEAVEHLTALRAGARLAPHLDQRLGALAQVVAPVGGSRPQHAANRRWASM